MDPYIYPLLIFFVFLLAWALADSIQRRNRGWIIALVLVPGAASIIWLAVRFKQDVTNRFNQRRQQSSLPTE